METAEPLTWRKSTYSTSNGGDCIEVSAVSDGFAVRDSKRPDGASLTFARDNWQVFIRSVKISTWLT